VWDRVSDQQLRRLTLIGLDQTSRTSPQTSSSGA
jgi:hypothetical protein